MKNELGKEQIEPTSYRSENSVFFQKNTEFSANLYTNFQKKNNSENENYEKKNEFNSHFSKNANKNCGCETKIYFDEFTSETKKNEMRNLSRQRTKRMMNISLVYSWELFDKNIDIDVIKARYFDLTQDQVKLLSFIQRNYTFLKKVIVLQLRSNWSWERIFPLIRSILIVGAAELFFIAPKIVFNESIEITKIFCAKNDTDYSFVNAVLQKIYDYYEIKNILRS
ncbi:transcription antitermination protein NusB [Mycoplasma sp. 'Moose RK']|nr:transcription antitermination protein NusB [Mycoplasma sp. 'Moose RK']